MKSLKTTLNCNTKETFDHIVLRGDPFNRGIAYGVQCRERIVENLKYYKKLYKYLDWSSVENFINNNYQKALKNYYPSAIIEMKGMAVGAGLSLTDIIAINASYELNQWNNILAAETTEQHNSQESTVMSNGCTTGVCLSKATKSGEVLLGQNWDNNKRLLFDDMAILLELHPDPREEAVPSIFALTEVGQLGICAMNSNGLAITGISLYSNEDSFGKDGADGYLPISLLIRMFVDSPNLPVGLKRVLSVPRHASINLMVVCSEGEALNIELTPNDHFIDYPSLQMDIYTHSNRFKSEAFLANSGLKDRHICGSSLVRDRQLERQLNSKFGSIDEKVFENSFKNHNNFPDSLCLHLPEKGRDYMSTTPNVCTIANIAFNLTTKTVRFCRGQPCSGLFKEFKFKDYSKDKGLSCGTPIS